MRSLLLFIVFFQLAACQAVTVQRGAGPVPVTLRVDDAAYWLEEWHRIRELPEDQLQLTIKTREHELARSPDSRNRLRLALLLAEGPQSIRDSGRALKLLRELDPATTSESAKALAALLEQVIGEQQWSGDKTIELRTKLKESETRVEELERQLQELTDIEQSIQQRN